MNRRQQKTDEFGSHFLAIAHIIFEETIRLTIHPVYRLFGVAKERINLRHGEKFLVGTSLLLILLVIASQYWAFPGWALLFLGNVRILQIISLNLGTLLFDFTPVGESSITILHRVRWHFVALGFSFVDTVLVFGFMYQFFDNRYQILNQHYSHFIDYFYYAMVTISTVGYGDIHPVTTWGRMIVMYEVSVALLFLAFFISGTLGRLHRHS